MLAFDVERTDAERIIAIATHLRGLRHALGEEFFSTALHQAIALELNVPSWRRSIPPWPGRI